MTVVDATTRAKAHMFAPVVEVESELKQHASDGKLSKLARKCSSMGELLQGEWRGRSVRKLVSLTSHYLEIQQDSF